MAECKPILYYSLQTGANGVYMGRACIIIVSIHTSGVFRKAAKEAGTLGYVWKEELETLNTVIEKLI